MRTVGINKSERLTHQQQLDRVRKFFQDIDPSHWGTGKMTAPDDFQKAEAQRRRQVAKRFQRRRDEDRLLKQVRMKIR